MSEPGEELNDDACIALALISGAEYYKMDNGPLHAFICCTGTCRACEPNTWGALGRRTKGLAARKFCKNHKLLATYGVTP